MFHVTRFFEVSMKVYRIKSKASKLSKLAEEAPDEMEMAEDESGEETPADILRRAADACDEGDHDGAMEMISEAMEMLSGGEEEDD